MRWKIRGQSATEYLMTYGWALLAIAIVGALLYMYVFSNKECPNAVRPTTQDNIVIVANQYQVYTDGTLKMMVKNALDKTITITNITVDGNKCDLQTPITLTPGATQQVSSDNVNCVGGGTLQGSPRNENSCAEVEVEFIYDIENGLSEVKATRKILTTAVAP